MDLCTVKGAACWFEYIHVLRCGRYVNLQSTTEHVNTFTHIDEFTTVLLHAGDDEKVERLLHAAVHCLMMGR